ncbi:DNA-3-methyladenine glycosylase family protein [Bacillus sp. FSL K6-3431]|uniref:DNA-3-methyladenine glycosylase family protein n=1 Tax=Bacillus sp. FSL K6-3431 TaxID=2921500 RepID=UPI0030F5499D
MWQEKIEVIGPYHFDLALSRLAIDPLHIVDRKERTVKVPIYGKIPEVATVQAVGTTEKPAFLVSGFDHSTKTYVLEKISFIFQLHTSLNKIQEHFSETALKNIFDIHRGTPIVLDFSLYTTLIKSIIHQQVNLAFAFSLTEQFVKTFGFQIDGIPFYPTAKTVSGLHIEQLRKLKFSQRKAEYIIDLSKSITNGELNLEDLSQQSDEYVMKELVKIRGIGPWTAQNFLLFGLGRPNLFPYADIGIQNAMKQLYGLERKPTMEEMLNYSIEWHPYLSFASLYLWRSIEPKNEG